MSVLAGPLGVPMVTASLPRPWLMLTVDPGFAGSVCTPPAAVSQSSENGLPLTLHSRSPPAWSMTSESDAPSPVASAVGPAREKV